MNVFEFLFERAVNSRIAVVLEGEQLTLSLALDLSLLRTSLSNIVEKLFHRRKRLPELFPVFGKSIPSSRQTAGVRYLNRQQSAG
jgi:hypothetical protein